MLSHKLVLDDVDIPFKLIAIHCASEEYKMAFLLNRHLQFRLSRAKHDHDFITKNVRAVFAVYKYNNQKQYCDFFLLNNKFKAQAMTNTATGSLFGEEPLDSNIVYLLPQYKKVDYLLKIEEEYESISEKNLVEKIKEIPQVTTAYAIDSGNLKYKDNLIFD